MVEGRFETWFPWTSLGEYEAWKSHLERGVGSFWTCEGERLALLCTYRNRQPVGIVRVLKVPIFPWDRRYWGEGDSRAEIQDLICSEDEEGRKDLLEAAIRVSEEAGLGAIGASGWRENQCEAFQKLGFKTIARSILLGWRTSCGPGKSNDRVKVGFVKPGEEGQVQGVFSANWGMKVTVVPYMEFQQPLVALIGNQPVGTVLLNEHSRNLDLGVQVLKEYRRTYVGSELVKAAITYYREQGFSHMYVIRSLPPSGLRASDEVAIQFYEDTGAKMLREYTCFRLSPREDS